MITFNRILAVIQGDLDSQPALSRAIELAQKTGAAVDALLVVYDYSYDMTTMLSRAEREAVKKAILKDRTEWAERTLCEVADVTINTAVVWSDSPYEAITRYAIENETDIVIKAARQHHDLSSVIFTPTDWNLLRKCPTPVLLVKEHEWPENGNILAAVNVGTEDDQHAQLNDKITQTTKEFADLLKGQAHLVNSYPATPLNIAIEIPEFNPETYNESVRNHHLKEMEAHSARFGISMSNCHVKEGLAERVVPRIAKHLDAELVVIGTVGRTGISAALIGNTAEHVIDSLNCDVLALKPDGFKSSIK